MHKNADIKKKTTGLASRLRAGLGMFSATIAGLLGARAAEAEELKHREEQAAKAQGDQASDAPLSEARTDDSAAPQAGMAGADATDIDADILAAQAEASEAETGLQAADEQAGEENAQAALQAMAEETEANALTDAAAPAAADAQAEAQAASPADTATTHAEAASAAPEAAAGATADAAASASASSGATHVLAGAAGAGAGGGASLGLLAGLPLLAAGGGGGGGGGAAPAPSQFGTNAGGNGIGNLNDFNGRVVDAYVAGATIFYDANGNGRRDAGEIAGTTHADGSYQLSGVAVTGSGRIVVEAGGIDSLTGQTVGAMAAPAGYTDVNPFTLLLAAQPGMTEAQLKAKLGLGAQTDFNNWDPLAAMQSGDPLLAAQAQADFIKSQQILGVIQNAAALKAHIDGAHGADGALDLADVTAVAAAVAAAISNGNGDWNSTLAQATSDAVDAAQRANGSPSEAALAQAVAGALAQVNHAIATSFTGLSAALKSGDGHAIAGIVAAMAISQDALADAIGVGNIGAIAALADADSLQRFISLYADAIANAGAGGHAHVEAMPVYTVQQVSSLQPPEPFLVADTSANLFAKLIQSHGPTFLGRASGVVALDAPTAWQAGALAQLPTLSFVQHEIASSGPVTVEYSHLGAMQAAGLCWRADADVTLSVHPSGLDSAITHAADLHAYGIRHFDIDGAQATITEAESTALLQSGIDFASGDHIVLGAVGTHLHNTLGDLHQLGVDEISGGPNLHVHAGQLQGSGSLPAFAAASTVTLLMQPGQLNHIIGHGAALHQAGIDHLDVNASVVDLSEGQAASLVQAGLSFTADEVVVMHSAGTHLQNSLHDLHDLGVDQVQGNHGPVVVQYGEDLADDGAPAPAFDAALDVSLVLQPGQLDRVLDAPATFASSRIDHLRIRGAEDAATPHALSAMDGATLLAALHDAGINDLRIEGPAPVSISDDQAAKLLLAGKLQVDAAAELTVQNTPPEPGEPGEPGAPGADVLDVTLAQLAQIGADHVAIVEGGALMVEVGLSLSNVDVNQELQNLLDHFTGGAPLFGDGNVTLKLGAVDVNQVSDSIAAELKLLGIDGISGDDGMGHPADRHLT